MAIYHLRAEMISRSSGRSATAAAAYRSGTEIEDRRTGSSFDYSRRGGVDHTEIRAPDDAPDWATDREELWNQVELIEKRINSQVAREIRVALPDELDDDERIELVRDFCDEAFVSRGMVADIAIHAPSMNGDERNYHAHIMLPTRDIGPDGFEGKNREWNKVETLESWRSSWAERSNDALERAGHDERIDHRTLEAQREEALERAEDAREMGDEEEALRETVRAVSLDREPLPQLSLGAWQMKERGIDVPAVSLWREVREQASEVARISQELAGQVKDWLDTRIERGLEALRERLEPAPEGPSLSGPEPSQDPIAERLRALLERSRGAQDGPSLSRGSVERDDREPEPKTEPQSLADRLRGGADKIDQRSVSDRLSELRAGWEADKQHQAREDAQKAEQERTQQQARNQDRGKDRGMDFDR